MATPKHDSLASIEGRLPKTLHVHRLGVQDIIIRDTEDGIEVYKRAGVATAPARMASHDGPIILDGRFYHVEEADYGYQAYHPFSGRGPHLDDDVDDEAVLLSEVERVV